MKKMFLFAFVVPAVLMAQSVDVKDVPTQGADGTTIEISKGKKNQNTWEVHDGLDDIEGDPAPLVQEARSNWKKACADWKKEFREDNKENKIIHMSCGNPECAGVTGSKTCVSKAKYKVKTKVN